MPFEEKRSAREKVVGVLGLAPYATADFYRKLLEATPAKKDWEHVRVLIDGNCKIPSRGRHLELGEEDPTPHIREAIVALGRQGADFVVIPCNTAHYFYEGFTRGIDVRVPHMIEETVRAVRQRLPGIRSVGLMASKITTAFKLYDRFLAPAGVEVLTLPTEQAAISGLIEAVKVGDDGPENRERARALAEQLANLGAEAVILGCTEISMLLRDGEASVPVFDSNRLLAEFCVVTARAPVAVIRA